jgi:hypothetical protein
MLVTNNCEDVTQIKLSRYPETTPVSAYLVDGLLVDTGLGVCPSNNFGAR